MADKSTSQNWIIWGHANIWYIANIWWKLEEEEERKKKIEKYFKSSCLRELKSDKSVTFLQGW